MRRQQDRRSFFARRRGPSKARLATVAHLLADFRQRHGREPTDEQLAGMLACSPEKAGRYRAALERNPS